MPKRTSDSGPVSRRGGKKARETAIHKWTKQEVDLILEYMVSKIKDGVKPMEPTSKSYSEKLIATLKLENITHGQLKNKVSNLKSSYLKMVKWRNATGQGVLANEGEASVRAYILKQCPEFDTLDEIFGSNVSLNPPFVHETNYEIVFDNSEVVEAIGADESGMDENEDEAIESESPDIGKKKSLLKSNLKHRPVKKDGLTAFVELQNAKRQDASKKYELELQKFECSKEWKAKEYELEKMKIESQREIKMKEIEKDERVAIAKLEMEKAERLEKYKLELEFRKY